MLRLVATVGVATNVVLGQNMATNQQTAGTGETINGQDHMSTDIPAGACATDWKVGTKNGDSCDKVCASFGKVCDDMAFGTIGDETEFKQMLEYYHDSIGSQCAGPSAQVIQKLTFPVLPAMWQNDECYTSMDNDNLNTWCGRGAVTGNGMSRCSAEAKTSTTVAGAYRRICPCATSTSTKCPTNGKSVTGPGTECMFADPAKSYFPANPYMTGTNDGSRAGNSSSDQLGAPDGLEGKPYDEDLKTGEGTHDSYEPTKSDPCTGKGLVCEFKDITQMSKKDYKPLDFVWKMIDPADWYKPDPYDMKTLPCEIFIDLPNATNGRPHQFFYLPLGQENLKHSEDLPQKYCDIEGILREVDNSELEMTDRVRVRAETLRVNNEGTSSQDLIGEFFDLTCGCTTKLKTQASLDLVQEYGVLQTAMQGIDQVREMRVQLMLFSDAELIDAVVYPEAFPEKGELYYFLARHVYDEDWDTQVQINKCVACDLNQGAACDTRVENDFAVVWFDQCNYVMGGPIPKLVSNTSWYFDHTQPAIINTTVNGSKIDLKPTGVWGESNQSRCPYHAVGTLKFSIKEATEIKISCAITACTGRPCLPCASNFFGATRRLLTSREESRRRALQAAGGFGEVELSTGINLNNQANANNNQEIETQGQKKQTAASNKKSSVSIILLVIVIGMLFLTALYMRSRIAAERMKNEQRGVEPEDAKNIEGADANSSIAQEMAQK